MWGINRPPILLFRLSLILGIPCENPMYFISDYDRMYANINHVSQLNSINECYIS